MKTLLVSYLPKFLSGLAKPLSGIGVYLSGKGVVDLSDAASVDAAGTSIAAGLVVIATAILSHLLGKWLNGGKPSGVGPGLTDKAPGWVLWLGMGSLAGFSVLSLPGCATTVTKTTMPDGTVIEVNAKQSDAAAIGAAVDLSRILLPILIHPDK